MNNDVISFLHERLKNNKIVVIYHLDNELFLENLVSYLSDTYDDYIILTDYLLDDMSHKQIEMIPKSVIEDIVELNGLYEFSDKMLIFSESDQFAGLFNYYYTGLLTQEEIIRACFG